MDGGKTQGQNQMNRPEVAYRVIYWSSRIDVDDRNSRTLSDGAQFRRLGDAVGFAFRIKNSGGAILHVQLIQRPTFWYESLEEYDRISVMPADEIRDIRLRGDSYAEARKA